MDLPLHTKAVSKILLDMVLALRPHLSDATFERLEYAISLISDADRWLKVLDQFPLSEREKNIVSRLTPEHLAQMVSDDVIEPVGVGTTFVPGKGFPCHEVKYKPLPAGDPRTPDFVGVNGVDYVIVNRLRLIQWTEALNVPERRHWLPDVSLPSFSDMLRDLVPGMKFTSFDLTASFFQILLSPEVRQFFGLQTESGERFQYKVLPMGCYLAVEVLQAVHVAIVEASINAVPRASDNVSYLVYVDNVRFASKSETFLEQVKEKYLQFCKDANFTLNAEPGNLIHQSGEFCGIMYSTEDQPVVSLPPGQLDKLKRSFTVAFNKSATVREFLGLMSRLYWCSRVLKIDLSFAYHPLKLARSYSRDVAKGRLSMDSKVTSWRSLRPIFKKLQNVLYRNEPTPVQHTGPSQYYLATDASMSGFGAVLIDKVSGSVDYMGGPWSPVESKRHINELEVVAITRALEYWPHLVGNVVELHVDNMTAKAVWKKGRAKSFFLNNRVFEGLQLRMKTPMNLHYINTVLNPSDEPSRGLPLNPAKVLAWAKALGLEEAFSIPSCAANSNLAKCQPAKRLSPSSYPTPPQHGPSQELHGRPLTLSALTSNPGVALPVHSPYHTAPPVYSEFSPIKIQDMIKANVNPAPHFYSV